MYAGPAGTHDCRMLQVFKPFNPRKNRVFSIRFGENPVFMVLIAIFRVQIPVGPHGEGILQVPRTCRVIRVRDLAGQHSRSTGKSADKIPVRIQTRFRSNAFSVDNLWTAYAKSVENYGIPKHLFRCE